MTWVQIVIRSFWDTGTDCCKFSCWGQPLGGLTMDKSPELCPHCGKPIAILSKDFYIANLWVVIDGTPVVKLTGSEEAMLRSIIADRGLASQIWSALYGGRPEDEWPDALNLVPVWATKLRIKLRPFRYTLEKDWGKDTPYRLVKR